ncbi:MAG: hypothetical protein Q8M16_00385, partial [Pirellulaceae bacterium]|nr:hypothetical protein [Pirellulaceae bacterium]
MATSPIDLRTNINDRSPATSEDSRLVNRLVWLTAATVFPLIWAGGLVTTTKAGMAVPDWPGTYGYNMFLYPWTTWFFGPWDLFIEHGHRLLGSLAGIWCLLLVGATWLRPTTTRVRALALGALTLVILQGVMGGVRVLNVDREIARIHGCLGPAFFAYLLGLTVVTSRWWKSVANRSFWTGGTGAANDESNGVPLISGQLRICPEISSGFRWLYQYKGSLASAGVPASAGGCS